MTGIPAIFCMRCQKLLGRIFLWRAEGSGTACWECASDEVGWRLTEVDGGERERLRLELLTAARPAIESVLRGAPTEAMAIAHARVLEKLVQDVIDQAVRQREHDGSMPRYKFGLEDVNDAGNKGVYEAQTEAEWRGYESLKRRLISWERHEPRRQGSRKFRRWLRALYHRIPALKPGGDDAEPLGYNERAS